MRLVQHRFRRNKLENIGNFLGRTVALVAVPDFDGDGVVLGADGNAHNFVRVRGNERGAAQHHRQLNPRKIRINFRHPETPRPPTLVFGRFPRRLHALAHQKVHAVNPTVLGNVRKHVPVLFDGGNVLDFFVALYRPIGLVQVLLCQPQSPSIR